MVHKANTESFSNHSGGRSPVNLEGFYSYISRAKIGTGHPTKDDTLERIASVTVTQVLLIAYRFDHVIEG